MSGLIAGVGGAGRERTGVPPAGLAGAALPWQPARDKAVTTIAARHVPAGRPGRRARRWKDMGITVAGPPGRNGQIHLALNRRYRNIDAVPRSAKTTPARTSTTPRGGRGGAGEDTGGELGEADGDGEGLGDADGDRDGE